ncbi:UDP-glucose 4-epimerase GalE [Virgisporangium aliadipatigenens]|uniref:UDP-glucose 4-epimerase n=1 Tax=Virgisporangium aliadipatigenens TaxID=741659 RepID=A0A8J3YVE3_9ACTN|nr:UDP-glucose 4-epimerase GalE [Virgisporangium aliadipatigenens]GIJ52276.1 UDP-glucose 4-epimerase GalE [Virgisporangium aliadipatigenens]
MKVLITGGAGYLGSTIASACLDSGIVPVILDNLSTGPREFVVGRIFYEGDVADGALVNRIFREHPEITATVHCAALIVVGDSVVDPLRYHRENVAKTIELLGSLVRNGCRRVLFSSSAAVYAGAPGFRVDEMCPVAPNSPYARTKAMVEGVLADACAAGDLRAVILRYFNPIGADPRLRTGQHAVAPTHALGRLIESYLAGEPFPITGVTYPTRDGTGLRDYIHVWDLAHGHLAALLRMDALLPPNGVRRHEIFNLGTGVGTTVREVVTAFERVVGERIAVRETAPRPGDVAGCYTANDKAEALLGWRARLSLDDGIRTALAWRLRHSARLGVAETFDRFALAARLSD